MKIEGKPKYQGDIEIWSWNLVWILAMPELKEGMLQQADGGMLSLILILMEVIMMVMAMTKMMILMMVFVFSKMMMESFLILLVSLFLWIRNELDPLF
jgi:hypothetical protein